jgi:glycine oxidase
MTQYTDFLIIGGGISGLLTARELCLAGCEVTVIDKSTLGQESSWAGGGILLPIYPWRQAEAISDLVIASLKIYPELSRELESATHIDPEWQPCGMLICKNPDFARATGWCESRKIRYQPAPQQRLEALTTQFQQPLWLPDIAQIRNPRLLKSLKAFLLQHGVHFVEHAELTRMEIKHRRINRVVTSQEIFYTDQVLICAGAWTADLLKQWLPETSLQLDIQPVRGQMLLFDAKPETLKHMVLDGDHYLIPRRDGKILAGSTVEQAGFEKITTDAAKQQLYNFATHCLPTLKDYPVCQHWAGLRPGTPDGIPYIGLHPEIKNLSINAGHFRNGLAMGPASAQLLADLILQRPTALDTAAYALSR